MPFIGVTRVPKYERHYTTIVAKCNQTDFDVDADTNVTSEQISEQNLDFRYYRPQQ